MKRLQEQTQGVIDEILPALVTIVSGKKATRPINSPLVAQLNHMFLYGGLPESVDDYFQNEIAAIGDSDISVTPVTETAWTDHEELIAALKEHRIPDVDIVRLDPDDRHKLAQNKNAGFCEAGNIVITRGGITALNLLCNALLFNFKKKPADKKLIIIQNKGGNENPPGYWTPILRAFGFSNPAGRKPETRLTLLSQLGVIISTDVKDTITQLKRHGKNRDKNWTPYHASQHKALNRGMEILQVTTNDQKILDAELIIEQDKSVAVIRPADDLYNLLEYVLSATEEKGTYAGNAKDKMDQAIQRILNMGAQEARRKGVVLDGLDEVTFNKLVWPLGVAHFRANAKGLHNGLTGSGALDTKTLALVTNDTGFHVEVLDDDGNVVKIDLATREEFADAKDYTVKGKPFPGVELNHVFDAMGGAEAFFNALKLFKENFEREREHPVILRIRQHSTYIAMQLADKYEDIKFTSSYANVRQRVVLEPRPHTDIPLTTEHYFLPENEGNKTFAEMGREASMAYTADAAALRTLLRQLGVPCNKPHLLTHRNAADATCERIKPVIAGYDAIKRIDWNDISGSMNAVFNNAHAFVFPNQGIKLEEIDPDPVMARLKCAYLFFSVIVGRQTRQRGIHGKVFAALGLDNPKHPFAPLWNYITKLRCLNLVKQKLDCILLDSKDEDETQRLIHQKLRHWQPHKQSGFEGEMYGVRPPDDSFHIAVLGSASTKKPADFLEAEHLLRIVYRAAKGMPLVVKYGGGRDGIMGRVHKFIQTELRILATSMPDMGAIYDYGVQCPETINLEGCDKNALSHKGRHPHDYFVIRKDIYQRMDEILEADAVVSLAGGAGTIQEDLHKIIKKTYFENVRGLKKGQIPLVFINYNGRYDEIQAMLPERFCKENGIYFVNADPAILGKDFSRKTALEQARIASDEAARIVIRHMKTWRPLRADKKRSAAPARGAHYE